VNIEINNLICEGKRILINGYLTISLIRLDTERSSGVCKESVQVENKQCVCSLDISCLTKAR
jgi:hypothetical protein